VTGAMNRGKAFGESALQMAEVKRRLVARLDELDAQRAAAAADPSAWDTPSDEESSSDDNWKL